MLFRHKPILMVLGLLGAGLVAGIAIIAKGPAGRSAIAGREVVAADGATADGRKALLDVVAGQIPNDIGSDRADNVKMTIEDCQELGGKALKVVFASPDSFGDRQARVRNWQEFDGLAFDAFNPGQEQVRLIFTVKHRGTRNLQTRVDVPIVLNPGRNSVRIGIARMANTNGSAPDLSDVKRWYLALQSPRAATFYLGTLWLDKQGAGPAIATQGKAVATQGPAVSIQRAAVSTRAAVMPARRYRVTGKIGGQSVDLIVTPEDEPRAVGVSRVAAPERIAAAGEKRNGTGLQGVADGLEGHRARDGLESHPTGASPEPAGDPARLARIRAAKMPPITAPVMFDTPEADAILSALEVFPPDNPWNQVVEGWPLHPNSKNIIASIGPDKPLRYNPDMGFILVPPDQKRIDVKISAYASESDKGPYPVPDAMPIEGWPAWYRHNPAVREKTLEDLQRDRFNQGGDRHAIVVDPVNRMLYEFYQARRTDAGWVASGAAIFDLKSNKLRPDGWTSADAAGLPIFPAVVRYDELQRGIVEHAMRVTVRKTRRAYVAPATHFASRLRDENLPRMGERIRLRRDFDISGFSPAVQAILKGLKKYGMFVADNGIDWAISVAPDERIPSLHAELRRIRGSAFEVVQAPH